MNNTRDNVLVAECGAKGGDLLAQLLAVDMARAGLRPTIMAADSAGAEQCKLEKMGHPSAEAALTPLASLQRRPAIRELIARYDVFADHLARDNVIIRLGAEATLGFLIWAYRTCPTLLVSKPIRLVSVFTDDPASRWGAMDFIKCVELLGKRLARRPEIGLIRNAAVMKPLSSSSRSRRVDRGTFEAFLAERSISLAEMGYLAMLERADLQNSPFTTVFDTPSMNPKASRRLCGSEPRFTAVDRALLLTWIDETLASLRRAGLTGPPQQPRLSLMETIIRRYSLPG